MKVVDFGIEKAQYRETRTRSGTVKGKFAYMSPEQCQAGQVDRRTDVFALGVIAWELLTGRRLFKRDSTYETYQAVVACHVPAPSQVNHELDPAVDDIVMKALAKEREQRLSAARRKSASDCREPERIRSHTARRCQIPSPGGEGQDEGGPILKIIGQPHRTGVIRQRMCARICNSRKMVERMVSASRRNREFQKRSSLMP